MKTGEEGDRTAIGNSFLRLFRRHGGAPGRAGPQQSDRTAREYESVEQEARRALLERISGFLTTHDLEVSSSNLAFAAMALSGSDLTLSRKIAERENAALPIDQHWLDELASDNWDAVHETILTEQLFARLEQACESACNVDPVWG